MRGLKRVMPAERLRLALILGLLGAFLLGSDFVERLDQHLYDLLLQSADVSLTGDEEAPETDVVVIAIDEKSLSAIGRWPWPRTVHARLIRTLSPHHSQPLVFDTLLTESGEAASDTVLAEAMLHHGNVWLPLHLQVFQGEFLEFLPVIQFRASARGLGHAHLPLDSDGIVRRIQLYEGPPQSPWPALSLAVAQHLSRQALRLPGSAARVRIPFPDGTEHLTRYSYIDVLEGRVPASSFTGKTLFVGATAVGLGDSLPTPMSGGRSTIPGVEVHATVFQALMTDKLIHEASLWMQRLLLVAAILLVVVLYPRIPPHMNLLVTLVLAAALVGLTYLSLTQAQRWLAPAATILTVLLAYPVWSWNRFRNLNQFLNQELEILTHERAMPMQRPNQTATEWAHHLVGFLRPQRWLILREKQQAPPEWKALLGDAGSVDLSLPGNCGRLLMHFPFALGERPELQSYIARVSQNSGEPGKSQRRMGHLIERRIQQVRQATATTRAMRSFVSDTLENMPDGVLLCDEIGRIFYANHQATAWLERPVKEGETLTGLLSTEAPQARQDFWQRAIEDVLFSKAIRSGEWQQNDSTRLIRLAPLNLSRPGQRGIVASLSDITAIRQAQRERLETIHFISHDLRSPLSSQLALLDRLQKTGREQPLCRESLLQLESLTRKSLGLADDFLQLARVEAQTELPTNPCLLIDLVDNAVDTLTPLASAVPVNLSVDADEEAENAFVQANANLIERAIGNLISNAIKFSPQNSEIWIGVSVSGARARVSVKDQGPGVDKEELPYLFQSFQRTRDSERRRKPGTGLGLRFVKTVVQRHQGETGLTSEPGEGACFWIELPLAAD